jgi:hypothetical protein
VPYQTLLAVALISQRKEVNPMYEKPELTLVASATAVVLGSVILVDDSENLTQQGGDGLVQGLDD